jgi:hypothetical protein
MQRFRLPIWLCFLLILGSIYLAIFIYLDQFQFPLTKDEKFYWPTSLQFSQSLIPGLSQLQNYSELSTPLPFIIFGILEHLWHGGIQIGRLLNFGLSFVIVSLVGLSAGRQKFAPVLAAIGLLLFPYYIQVSTLLYTDIIAAFFVLIGFWLYTHKHHALSSLVFILAIASRQFAIAFPLAIFLYEFTLSLKSGLKIQGRWFAYMIAVSSILGWVLLFKGLMPANVIVTRADFVPEVQRNVWSFSPNNGLYFLCFIGLYFVILEAILFHEGIVLKYAQKPQALLITWLVAILFFIFPPSEGSGGLPVLLKWLPGTSFDTAILYTLGLLVCIRFCRINLAFWMLLTNWLVMTKAYPWDKYALPLLAILWYLKASDTLDEPVNKLQTE